MKDQALSKEYQKQQMLIKELREQNKLKDAKHKQMESNYQQEILALSENLQMMQIQASENLQLGKDVSDKIQREIEAKY